VFLIKETPYSHGVSLNAKKSMTGMSKETKKSSLIYESKGKLGVK
jgi:hypothetical protein